MPWKRVIRIVAGVALAAVVYLVVFPRIASYGAVGHRLATISAPWIAGLAAASLLDVVTTAPPWRVLLPQLSWLGALGFTQASTALTAVLPGGAPLGMAVSFGLLKRLRVGSGPAGFAVALTGIWSQGLILVYPLAGAVLVLGSGRLSGATLAIALASGGAAAAIAVLVVAAFRSPRLARRLGERFVDLRNEQLGSLRRRWPALTAATIANHLSAYVVFELSIRAVGLSVAQLPLTETFLAWAIGRVITSLPLTPGGVGFVELGLIGTLVGFGGDNAHVVAAVLLYRGVIVLPTLVVGFTSLALLRRPGPAYGSASTTSSRGSS
jgi:putative heme transporter